VRAASAVASASRFLFTTTQGTREAGAAAQGQPCAAEPIAVVG
jgi:hypothetical protein